MEKKCPWCESTDIKAKMDIKDYFLSQEDFQLLECGNCNLTFTSPIPSDISNYYKSENYLSHKDDKKGIIPFVYKKIKKINIKYKFKIASQGLKENFSILDIGCGIGDFLLYAKEHNCTVYGIEPNEEARLIAENKLNTKLYSPDNLQNIPDNSIELITMWHVLEHVDNLKEEISQLERILKENGRLVLALPNYNSFDAEYYKDKWAAYDVPRHLYHFSQTSIKNIFNKTSLHLSDTKPLKWDSYYISMMSEGYVKGKTSLLKSLLIGWKSNRKARKNMEYSSLIYVLDKKVE